jgi:hypothetical protein
MRDYDDNRAPEEIVGDIERTRAEVSSTIDAIQSKLTPGQLMDQAITYARTSLPADFGANLGNTVRDNPVPVALMGIGIAWLMMSSRSADGQARARRQAADYDLAYATGYGTDFSSAREESTQHATSRMSETGRDLKDRASEATHRVMDKASEFGDRISAKTSELTGRAREASHSARERLHGSGNAHARMDELGQQSQQQYYRAKDNFTHMIDEHPLMLGVMGVAIGAMLGAALPGTRREDEMMGRTRDDLLDRAKETGRAHADTVKESVQRATESVKQEVNRVAGEASSSHTQGNGPAHQATETGVGADGTKQGSAPGQQSIH